MILQGAGQGEGQMRLRIIGKEKRTEIISWVKKIVKALYSLPLVRKAAGREEGRASNGGCRPTL